jgi:uncharacterized protein (DUF2147 family)
MSERRQSAGMLRALVVLVLSAAPATPGLVGEWWTAERDSRICISCDGGTCTGTICWLAEPTEADGGAVLDTENPKKALRARPLLGLPLLTGLTPDGPTTWSNGTLYDPTDGSTYRGKVTVKSDTTLELRGYVGIPLFGRSETWVRFTADGGQ